MLFDGENYLIDDFQISTSTGFQIQSPEEVKWRNNSVFVAGLSRESPSFTAPTAPPDISALLPVEEEIEAIREIAPDSKRLINQQFTVQNTKNTLSLQKYDTIHLSTHANFSSDPSRTVVLAWDKPIALSDLKSFLSNSSDSKNIIDLLVLSACETAKGDKRSSLAIAGIAAQSGARTTLASIWSADASATAALMKVFYENLASNMSKAEALQNAQQQLQKSDNYKHPYFWAGFNLVGSGQ